MFGKVIAICAIGFFVIAADGFTLAAVPLQTIQGWRDAATDVVNITVLSVDRKSSTKPYGTNGSITKSDISLTVGVEAVDRSANALTPQTTIVVQYGTQSVQPPLPGMNFGFALEVGERARAYLTKKNGNTYELACSTGCLERLKRD
jgi:hypothetical protein